MKRFEIMAPAGSFECLTAAIEGGADSVYFGVGHLNMRSRSASNFAAEDLPEVCRICRAYGIRSYLTLNITLFDGELDEARRTLDAALAAGTRLRAHLKLDTGMGRLGILTADAPRVIREVKRLRHLDCEGIFSHCASMLHRTDRHCAAILPCGDCPRVNSYAASPQFLAQT